MTRTGRRELLPARRADQHALSLDVPNVRAALGLPISTP
jgi:hypothetical protein